MREYDNIVPGAAERIIRMAEANSTDRSALEHKLVDSEIEASKSGLAVAAVLALMCTGAAIGFFAVGLVVAGSVMLGLPAVTMIGTFITRGVMSADSSSSESDAGSSA